MEESKLTISYVFSLLIINMSAVISQNIVEDHFIEGPSTLKLRCKSLAEEQNRIRCAVMVSRHASHNFAFVVRAGSCIGCQTPLSAEESEEIVIQGPHWVRSG